MELPDATVFDARHIFFIELLYALRRAAEQLVLFVIGRSKMDFGRLYSTSSAF